MTYDKCRGHVERQYRDDFRVLGGIRERGGHDSGRVSVSVEGGVELCHLPFYVDWQIDAGVEGIWN